MIRSARVVRVRSGLLAGGAPSVQLAPTVGPTLAVSSEARQGTLMVAVPSGPVIPLPTTALGGLQSVVQPGVETCVTVIGTLASGEPSRVTVTLRLIVARVGVGVG